MGEVIMGRNTFHNRPLFLAQWPTCSDQINASQLLWAAASAAPHRPPIRAWEDEDGRPFHQVIRFQMMPPSKAHRMTCELASTTFVLMMPVAMVAATAVPIRAPIRFITAARATAQPGASTLVATTVAMELAVSWNPLMNSNTSAARITIRTSVSMGAACQLFLRTIWYATTPASRQRSMAFSRISKNSLSRNICRLSRRPE